MFMTKQHANTDRGEPGVVIVIPPSLSERWSSMGTISVTAFSRRQKAFLRVIFHLGMGGGIFVEISLSTTKNIKQTNKT